MRCPNCGTKDPNVYVGFSVIECVNTDCNAYAPMKLANEAVSNPLSLEELKTAREMITRTVDGRVLLCDVNGDSTIYIVDEHTHERVRTLFTGKEYRRLFQVVYTRQQLPSPNFPGTWGDVGLCIEQKIEEIQNG